MQTDVPSRRLLGLSRRIWLVALALGLLGFGAAAVAAPSGLFGHRRHGHGFFGHGGHGHGDHAWSEEHVELGVRHALREADPSDAQVEAVTAIVREAATGLRAFHDDRHAFRDAWSSALVSADRAALEARRTEALATFDEASQRVVAALADTAEVLTPEQRQRLADAHGHHADD
ncbi:MAG: Spy/CpxP family protein refolding chaperone [Myxococcota bacterium]